MSVYTTNINQSPQQLLDALHQVNVPRLYDPALSAQQRHNLIAMVKNELHDWRQMLRDQMTSVRRRYSPQEAAEAKIALAPFRLLDNLGKELAQSVDKLEKLNQANRPIPEGFTFGNIIFGTPDLADWHLGFPQDAGRYDDMMAIRRRLEDLLDERAPVEAELKQLTQRIKAQQGRLKDDMTDHQRRTNLMMVSARAIFVSLFVVGLMLVTYAFYTTEAPLLAFIENDVAGLLMLTVIVILLAAMLFDRRRRLKTIAQLEDDIASGKRRLAQLKQRHKGSRQHYYPLNELVQQLQNEYNTLRETF